MLEFSGWKTVLENNDFIKDLIKKYNLDRIYRIKFINRDEFKGRRLDYFDKQKEETIEAI